MLWLRTVVFTILVPGTVLGLVPLVLLSSRIGPRLEPGAASYLGLAPLLGGVAVIGWCFVDFIRKGRGTPAPYDPPRVLVIEGLYRYVRNPQYLGVFLVAVGEAVVGRAPVLLAYTAFLVLAYNGLVRLYEEPALTRVFGESYLRYSATVPRWIPRRNKRY